MFAGEGWPYRKNHRRWHQHTGDGGCWVKCQVIFFSVFTWFLTSGQVSHALFSLICPISITDLFIYFFWYYSMQYHLHIIPGRTQQDIGHQSSFSCNDRQEPQEEFQLWSPGRHRPFAFPCLGGINSQKHTYTYVREIYKMYDRLLTPKWEIFIICRTILNS